MQQNGLTSAFVSFRRSGYKGTDYYVILATRIRKEIHAAVDREGGEAVLKPRGFPAYPEVSPALRDGRVPRSCSSRNPAAHQSSLAGRGCDLQAATQESHPLVHEAYPAAAALKLAGRLSKTNPIVLDAEIKMVTLAFDLEENRRGPRMLHQLSSAPCTTR